MSFPPEKDLMLAVSSPNFFWPKFQQVISSEQQENDDEIKPEKHLRNIIKLFKDLWVEFDPWLCKSIEKSNIERHLLIIKAGLLLNKPKICDVTIKDIFKLAFNVFKKNFETFPDNSEILDTIDDTNCLTCNNILDDCKCSMILGLFSEILHIFCELDLVDEFINSAITYVVSYQLKGFIEKTCKGEFFEPMLENVFKWMELNILGWLQFILKQVKNVSYDRFTNLTIEDWKLRLNYFIYKLFGKLRISELFEIIVEYPESLPAVKDLKECLSQTETRTLLTQSLKASFENRLLHPAVNTDDILTQYVSAIKTLRELDPSGVILENVCSPLREYLRSRDDTIKCIISCLTDQDPSSGLAEELLGSSVLVDDIEEFESDGEDWVPDPIDAPTDLSSKERRTADIINILVNIYGSQDMFVSQYRVLLADRILTNFSYDVTNERRYLELLKKRFGENHLHFCDIMLKDIQDSQRINRLIKRDIEQEGNAESTVKCPDENVEFNSFIVSATFWPSLSEDTVEPPNEIKTMMNKYAEIYKNSKGGNRTLNWFSNVGSVEIEVEINDSTKTFHVTPAQATLLLKFQEKDEWSLNELAEALNISKSAVRNRTSFWIGHGVIIENQNDVFVGASTLNAQNLDSHAYLSDDESSATSSQNQKDEELQVYWSYIVGMLTNLGPLTIDRIHGMLKMFAMADDSSKQCSITEVKTFLQDKINDGLLLCTGGTYKLPPKSD